MKLIWYFRTHPSEGKSTPGARLTAVPWGEQVALFITDPNGGVYTTAGGPRMWGPWASVSEGRSTPGAPVTAVPWTSRFPFALFIADPNGGIYTAAGDPQAGFGPWASVSEGRSTPGAPVTAVPWTPRFPFALFIADPNGGIYTAAGDPQAGFGPWASVSEGRSTPGAPVTAVPWTSSFPFALFIADPNGGIYTAAGDPQAGFGPWASVSDGRSTPGAPVTAVPWGNRFALFIADPNGGIYMAVGDPQAGFGPWSSVSDIRSMPGAPITAVRVPWSPDLLALFVTDTNGGIYANLGNPSQGWGSWSKVQLKFEFLPNIAPGSPDTPVLLRSEGPGERLTDYVGLFFTDRNGSIVGIWSYLSPPSAPIDLRVTSVTAHTINVAWTWNNSGDDADGFRVRFSGKRGSQVDSRPAPALGAAARTASLTELLSGYEYTISVVAFNAAGESPGSNVVTATTPIVPETVNVSLKRQQIIEGPIPYAGQYPSFGIVQPGHLLQIRLPAQGSVVAGLQFVKLGHSSEECANPNAVVVLSAGQSTTEAQMIGIYGVSKPTYSSSSPVPFVACLLSPQVAPQLPDFINMELTVISDVG